jgi:hypothetical protein
VTVELKITVSGYEVHILLNFYIFKVKWKPLDFEGIEVKNSGILYINVAV